MRIAIVLITVFALIAIGQPVISAETGMQNQTNHEHASPMMQDMLERMHALRLQMAEIDATEDSNERHRLTHAHMESMRGAMMMMMDTMDMIDRQLQRSGKMEHPCPGMSDATGHHMEAMPMTMDR
ncbi:MAG: hypothetical protein GTO41_23660 [Burkholderiales bacterium]|nr:hypothetical protein [Burkholderiales bacterium]